MSLAEEVNAIRDNIASQEKLLREKVELLRQEECRKRDVQMKLAIQHIDTLLDMTPDHDRTSCSDEKPDNYGSARCNRCVLLFAKKNGYFQEDVQISISITKPD